MARTTARYGWKPDLPDHRDYLWHETEHGKLALAARLPDKVSLRDKCPPIWDQGQLGSCTAHGVGGALVFEQMKQGEPYVVPSRLFIYYGERVLEGTTSYDAGAEVRDGLKVVANTGAPPETDWPYNIARFAQKPPAIAYTDATKHKALTYTRLLADGHLRACLAAGSVFTFGFTVFESFESLEVERSGIVPLPDRSESVVGGHCVDGIGYDNARRLVECRNSYGPDWGDEGHFWLPYDYFTTPEQKSLATDFWNVTLTS